MVDVDFVPTDQLQIVVWIEDTAGNYVDTIYITQSVGHFGLGNRPGELQFNSAPLWPYGRRETTFPVWAHRHGMSWPQVGFQDANESGLSHDYNQSSAETHYCLPTLPDDPIWDTQTCATPHGTFTDKGKLSTTNSSLYPPRADVVPQIGSHLPDDPSTAMFASLNPFDAVSQATPTGGQPFSFPWSVPNEVPSGSYVMFVEVSKEFDDNDTYNATSYPAPTGIPYGQFGKPYRGQPSIVYSVPFTIGVDASLATTSSYIGYGDPDGQDGIVRAPDDTIDTATPGSGASRLSLTMGDDNSMYRVRLNGHAGADGGEPGAITAPTVASVDQQSAIITFLAPAVTNGLSSSSVSGYQIAYRSSEPMTEANFATSIALPTSVTPGAPGTPQSFEIEDLVPLTTYYVGVRAYDACQNLGPLTVVKFTTTDAPVGQVDACFIATAAYGSLMANDVVMLRGFRDAYLRSNVLGEIATEAYYTFGPAIADTIAGSELLRTTTRDALAPFVQWVRGLAK